MKRQKYSILFLLMFAVCAMCAGCGTSGEKNGTGTVKEEKEPAPGIDGWWYCPEDMAEEDKPLIDIFSVDTKEGTWSYYNSYGMLLNTGTSREEEGNLVLGLEGVGESIYQYKDNQLFDENGDLIYVKGNPMETFDASELAGDWYYFGDTSGKKIHINEDYTFTVSEEGMDAEEGTWKINDGFENEYYIHESAIDTEKGAELKKIGDLLSYEWVADPELELFPTPTIEFADTGTFTYVDGATEGEIQTAGTWSFKGNTLTMEFDDGNKEEIEYSETGFEIKQYGVKFVEGTLW